MAGTTDSIETAAYRLLVIDDDRSVLQSIAHVVRARLPEWTIDTQDDPATALRAIVDLDYDVIMSDIRMPQHSGLSVMHAVLERRRYTPFIFLTAYGTRPQMLQTAQAGAFAFLAKPVDPDCLVASLRSALAVRQLHLELQRHAQALSIAHAELEQRVVERTAELARANEGLRHEIGERKRAETALRAALGDLQQKQDQLVQAAKLATVGEMATGLAHELNNPLNNIGLLVGNAVEQLRCERRPSASTMSQLQSALEQVSRASAIIRHLLTFGRRAGSSREPVCVNDVVTSACRFIEKDLKKRGVQCQTALAPALPKVSANRIQLEQVLLNLLTNARDAVEECRVKQIAILTRVIGCRIEVVVEDTGKGMNADAKARIFDPFFTTKDAGRGTGLGLSVSDGIVRDHEGAIHVASEPGRGATFTVSLPADVTGDA